jgi:hypothetical protein
MKNFDLVTTSTACVKDVVGGFFQDELDCFMSDIGFTEDCAKIWLYNVGKTAEACGGKCAASRILRKSNNGPSPTCTLTGGLQCDEKKAGPVFKQFAGRTRRRSGLLLAIARPSDTIAPITPIDCA